MNRNEAIKWCKDSLPQWPDVCSDRDIKQLAKPTGWNWKISRLPYAKVFKLVLIMGDNDCIRESHVFIPPAIPPAIPPVVAPPWSDIVKHFIKTIKIAKDSSADDENCEVLMNQKNFDEVSDEYLPLKMSSNINRTKSIVDDIKVRVIDDDILIISKFLELEEPLFKVYCLSEGTTSESVMKTLTHSDD